MERNTDMTIHEMFSSEGLIRYDDVLKQAFLHNHPNPVKEITDKKRLVLFHQIATQPGFKGGNHYCEKAERWFLTDFCDHCGSQVSK